MSNPELPTTEFLEDASNLLEKISHSYLHFGFSACLDQGLAILLVVFPTKCFTASDFVARSQVLWLFLSLTNSLFDKIVMLTFRLSMSMLLSAKNSVNVPAFCKHSDCLAF